MNRSLNTKKKQHTAAGAKRSVSLLSSEEELSDRRSSSSIESAESHKESKCQRSTRKAAKKGWQEKFEPFDCQFVVSSTSDEEWNEMVPKHSSDSDIDWNPEKSQVVDFKPTYNFVFTLLYSFSFVSTFVVQINSISETDTYCYEENILR